MIKLFFMDYYRFYSKLLMIVVIIIITMNNMCMANIDNSIILHGSPKKQTGWDYIRYPYKSVYGLPNSLYCDESTRNKFNECEISFHRKWEIAVDHYFYETKKFCCFILETMNCELDVAKKCNEQYSKKLESNTRDTFKKVCDKIVGSNYGWHCWWTEKRIINAWIITGVILLVITVACVAGLIINKHIKNKKMEAVDKAMDNARLKTPTTTPLKRRRVPPKTTYVDKDLIKEYHKILSKQMVNYSQKLSSLPPDQLLQHLNYMNNDIENYSRKFNIIKLWNY
ncbi:uncharacterized protein LOC142646358 [Dermatophagoides pteronyssinus]|uniref:uncharacterized protein LOC142646358 n=1 Tax=Dermatophagoides pteronyssinus TaxID=6956 RepID=UPI003F66EBC6